MPLKSTNQPTNQSFDWQVQRVYSQSFALLWHKVGSMELVDWFELIFNGLPVYPNNVKVNTT